MKEKNKKLLILVGVLLLTFGSSLAYFIARVYQSGTGSKVVATTVRLEGSTIKVEGTLEFHDTDVYPGHTAVSAIKLTATGDNELVPYNLIWKGESGISGLNYTVYKTSTSVNVTSTCEKKHEVKNGVQQYFEECNITNLDQLGTPLGTGSINKGDTKSILAKDEFVTASSTGTVWYYYVILEYPNLPINQNDDKNATFEGEVTVEESDKKPDINILAFKVEQEDGSYKEQTDIPGEGYQFNQEKSTCTNGAIPGWDKDNKRFYADNLTKSGTSCYLTFDTKKGISVQDLIASLDAKTDVPDFTKVAITDEGVYATDDPMYATTDNPNPKTYYWRGATTTNHLIFANKCWRIVRINGDGTIRLIYNGAVQPGNKCNASVGNTDAVIYSSATSDRYYATSGGAYNNASYVGWTYSLNTPRTLSGTDSNAKVQTEKWFNNNSNFTASQREQVATGKFCNDREVQSGSSFSSSSFSYAANKRLYTDYQPTLACNEGDVYKVQVAAITVDEVMLAGGKDADNTSYYLHAGQNYWTMSPSLWNGSGAWVFFVRIDGSIDNSRVSNAYGLRPVINLKADTTFTGNGTFDSPFAVVEQS